jgi:hypothetical protein
VVCADELGPVIPRSFPPGWTADGHRVKAPGRRPQVRSRPGCTARSAWPTGRRDDDRTLPQLDRLPAAADHGRGRQPDVTIVVITDNLSSHTSSSTRTWLADHPRIRQLFIPKGAAG